MDSKKSSMSSVQMDSSLAKKSRIPTSMLHH